MPICQRNICISLAGDVIPWVFKKPRLQIFKLFHLLSFRYRGYRDKPMSIKENPYGNLTNNYDFTKDYWHILSAQLFFVIAFLVSDFHIVCNIAFTRQGCKLLSDIGQCPTKFGKCPSKSNFDRTNSQKKNCHIHFFAVAKSDCKFTQFAFCNKIYEAFWHLILFNDAPELAYILVS